MSFSHSFDDGKTAHSVDFVLSTDGYAAELEHEYVRYRSDVLPFDGIARKTPEALAKYFDRADCVIVHTERAIKIALDDGIMQPVAIVLHRIKQSENDEINALYQRIAALSARVVELESVQQDYEVRLRATKQGKAIDFFWCSDAAERAAIESALIGYLKSEDMLKAYAAGQNVYAIKQYTRLEQFSLQMVNDTVLLATWLLQQYFVGRRFLLQYVEWHSGQPINTQTAPSSTISTVWITVRYRRCARRIVSIGQSLPFESKHVIRRAGTAYVEYANE